VIFLKNNIYKKKKKKKKIDKKRVDVEDLYTQVQFVNIASRGVMVLY